jgi:hypothetical protein
MQVCVDVLVSVPDTPALGRQQKHELFLHICNCCLYCLTVSRSLSVSILYLDICPRLWIVKWPSIFNSKPYASTCVYFLCEQMYVWAGYLSRCSHWLRAGRSGDRIPVGARFSAPVQTGPGAHPASCTMRNGSFPWVESGRGVTFIPHPFLVPRSKNRVTTTLPKGLSYLQKW